MYTYIHIHTYKTATKEKMATTLGGGAWVEMEGGNVGGTGGKKVGSDIIS